MLPQRIRVDKGTETGIMTTMHCFLIDKKTDLEDATESVLFGPSTQNKIERWWRELLERMEKYFKLQLSTLIEDGDYDATDEIDRYIKNQNLLLNNKTCNILWCFELCHCNIFYVVYILCYVMLHGFKNSNTYKT